MKKKRPEQAGAPIMVRIQPDQLAALDAWIATQYPKPSRPEAVRQILKEKLG